MRALTAFGLIPLLAACNLGAPETDGTPRGAILALAEDRTCPLPVPERDTLLASALLAGDTGPVDAFLAQRPQDLTAQAVKAALTGEAVVDPDQAACIAPYL